MKIPTEWTTAERIDMATTLLQIIRNDVLRECYSRDEHPDIPLVLRVLNDDPATLNNEHSWVWLKRALEACGIPCD
jgi:hypothetical protein